MVEGLRHLRCQHQHVSIIKKWLELLTSEEAEIGERLVDDHVCKMHASREELSAFCSEFPIASVPMKCHDSSYSHFLMNHD